MNDQTLPAEGQATPLDADRFAGPSVVLATYAFEYPEDLFFVIPRAEVARVVGVAKSSISNALSKGGFPPGWYGPLARHALETRSMLLPTDIFRWNVAGSARRTLAPIGA